MDSVNSISQRILRFSGVQPQVLQQLETDRLKQDAHNLFGEKLDVFVKSGDHIDGGTVELVADDPNAKSLPYASGLFRALHRALTQQDPKATEVSKIKTELTGDLFERSVESKN